MPIRTVFLATLMIILHAAVTPPVSADQRAKQILRDAKTQGGLIVHLGCGDGRLTAALRADGRFLVHGLDRSDENIASARRYLRQLDQQGVVSVERWIGSSLPYVDNLVNLLVVEDGVDVSRGEVLRVLVPGGIALLAREGAWDRVVKTWPDGLAEWSHYLYDASNNAVTPDERVGSPRHLQWTAGPLWSRSHETASSLSAMVSGGGRVFYVFDEGLTGISDTRIPHRWTLTARDAFNGILLWQQPVPEWHGGAWKNLSLRGRPPSVPRRIVAAPDRLYVTLGHEAGLSVLDSATGRTITQVPETQGTQEILLVDQTLLLRTAVTGTARGQARGFIAAIDCDSDRVLWRTRADRFLAQSLAANSHGVVYHNGQQPVCLDLANGSRRWPPSDSIDRTRRVRDHTLILHEQLVLEAEGAQITARSLADGKVLWTTRSGGKSMRPGDLFVAQNLLWHAAGEHISGYDLATGKPTRTVDPSSVQSQGHHLRCYRAKATERFLITQFRGAEFISLTGEEHSQNDWVRGACRYGVMPSAGMLYVPPNPCFCYPAAKLTGFLALAPKQSASKTQATESRATESRATESRATESRATETRAAGPDSRVQRGPAFGMSDASPAADRGGVSVDWPTYRHDARRSGASDAEVSAQVTSAWTTGLGGDLTAPVLSDGRVFVARKDQHTLVCLDIDDGRRQWDFTAGGPIDSPPSILGQRVLFGCSDGYVYCLRSGDGVLVWRTRAAPSDRRMLAFGRLESPWRVHGSVLPSGGLVYCTAGRSSYLDGGIWVLALNPTTGRIVYESQIDTWSPTRNDAEDQPFIPSYHMEGTHSDVLVGQQEAIYLAQYKFNQELQPSDAPYVLGDPRRPATSLPVAGQPFTSEDPLLTSGEVERREFHRYLEDTHPELLKAYQLRFGEANLGDRLLGRHLMATAGFLDDSWFNRTYWMYSDVWPGWYLAHRGAMSGQLVVVGRHRTYSVQAFPVRNKQSPMFTPGDRGYLLAADDADNLPVLDDKTRGATKGLGFTRRKPPSWFDWVPIRMRAMVLAGNHLFVVGPPDAIDPQDPMATFEGRRGSVLRAYQSSDGKLLTEQQLDTAPVFDGLIATQGRLIMCTVDGHVVCLKGKG